MGLNQKVKCLNRAKVLPRGVM